MISVEHLSKRYGSFEAVRDLSFEVRAGEVLGFLGPNGAGKSTTMRILTGFLCPTSGRASIAGHDVVERPLEARRHLGYLPEHAPVYTDLTVLEYLRFIAGARGIPRARRRAAIDQVVADCGLREVLRRPIGHLSKGYRQRTCMAQALVHRPDVLILDEPTSGLDPNQIIEIRDLVSSLATERAIVWSTHILSEVEALCERVLIIDSGRPVALGHPRELKARVPGNRPFRLVVASSGGSKAGEETSDRGSAIERELGSIPSIASFRRLESDADGSADLAWYVEPDSESEPLTARDAVFERTKASGWALRALVPEEPTLEDVFRHLTSERASASGVEARS